MPTQDVRRCYGGYPFDYSCTRSECALSGADPTHQNDDSRRYFETRLKHDSRRSAVWRHICDYLERYIDRDADVLELAAGWCDFSNSVRCNSITAMDLNPDVHNFAAPHVTTVDGDCTDLSRFEAASFDVVLASNFLEHLSRAQTDMLLEQTERVLRPGGRLILIQPNFRLSPRHYFDDYTHVQIFTDRSLSDYLEASGWSVEKMYGRFLPLTVKSKAGKLTFLVPWYLRSPVKPLAGQMMAVATRPE